MPILFRQCFDTVGWGPKVRELFTIPMGLTGLIEYPVIASLVFSDVTCLVCGGIFSDKFITSLLSSQIAKAF